MIHKLPMWNFDAYNDDPNNPNGVDHIRIAIFAWDDEVAFKEARELVTRDNYTLIEVIGGFKPDDQGH